MGQLRYLSDTVGERGAIINDPWKAPAARLLNFYYRNVVVLKTKGVKGEVIERETVVDDDPQLAPYFFHVIEGGSEA